MTTILCASLASDLPVMHRLQLGLRPTRVFFGKTSDVRLMGAQRAVRKGQMLFGGTEFLRFVVLITPVDTVDNPALRGVKAFYACG